jgi:replication fork clamp-binding protein CrfC
MNASFHKIMWLVYSNECPDLTLIDLPGITRVAVQGSDQKVDIEKVTTEMVAKYCRDDERTIILCVIPANVDLSTSHALALARKWDSKGERSLGVITKIDLMDKGTDARGVLQNKEISLRFGYVGIKNRSQEDINNKVRVKESLDKEEQYFREHRLYSSIDQNLVGTRSLTRRLTDLLFKSIRSHLPEIMKEINSKIKECE